MRLSHRLIPLAVLVALSSALAGCGSMSGFDPTDLFDFLDQKKKLQGERKPVFPEGVPGLEQGVPKSLYKGSIEEQQREQAASEAAMAQPPVEAKPKHSGRSKSRSSTATSRPAPAPDAEAPPEEEGSTAAAPPAPRPAKPSRRRITAPPPDNAAEPAAPAQTQQSAPSSSFPAPLPSGSFQR
jgi:hypothetical protein